MNCTIKNYYKYKMASIVCKFAFFKEKNSNKVIHVNYIFI